MSQSNNILVDLVHTKIQTWQSKCDGGLAIMLMLINTKNN